MIYWQVSIVKSNIHLSPWYIIIDRYAGGIFFMYLEEVLKEFLFDCKMKKLSERILQVTVIMQDISMHRRNLRMGVTCIRYPNY